MGRCPHCHEPLTLHLKQAPLFCPHCQQQITHEMTEDAADDLLPPPQPPSLPAPLNIGPYRVIKRIGMGGMGEVFEAEDPFCKRRVAIKRIRPDKSKYPILHKRFVREAYLTAQLTHPSIIPIYAIEDDIEMPYYVMPYIEGKTLKQIFQETGHAEKEGKRAPDGSIPTLISIFLNTCQAIAYAHSQGILHRDVKPENIIVGQYGQVLIVDWGLIKRMDDNAPEEEVEEEPAIPTQATLPGKVIGTLAYMAPERAFGAPPSVLSDIYALGVILYQILCLHLPFRRSSLASLRQEKDKEVFFDPASLAPYRDVPQVLTRIVKKCLSPHVEERYQTVDALIKDIESYARGSSDWMLAATLHFRNRYDWEFCENILMPSQQAIAGKTVFTNWVGVMLSKHSFSGNTAIETQVSLGTECHGIGLLLNIPENEQRNSPIDGYFLWLSATTGRPSRLYRSGAEVLLIPDLVLPKESWSRLRLESINHKILFYLNGTLSFSYISYLPIDGTHVGLVYEDTDFELSDCSVYVKSLDLVVSCLAVPDAFLAQKEYPKALIEYRRIAKAFPGQLEGREALFRAGLTLLEQVRHLGQDQRVHGYDLALEEFEKLRTTPGAPLEYLGKALVYESLGEVEEEAKCFELALRKYARHPLVLNVEDHLVFRLHQAAHKDRLAAYRFAYLTIRYLPHLAHLLEHRKLLLRLKKHWDPLPFLQDTADHEDLQQMLMPLAFWIARPYALLEMGVQTQALEDLIDSFTALITLDATEHAQQLFDSVKERQELEPILSHFAYLLSPLDVGLKFLLSQDKLDETLLRLHFVYLDRCLATKRFDLLDKGIKHFSELALSPKYVLRLTQLQVWSYLIKKEWDKAKKLLLHTKSNKDLFDYLRACYLSAAEGEETALVHLAKASSTPYPPLWAVASYYIVASPLEREAWLKHAFPYEKQQLALQLSLWHICSGQEVPEIYL